MKTKKQTIIFIFSLIISSCVIYTSDLDLDLDFIENNKLRDNLYIGKDRNNNKTYGVWQLEETVYETNYWSLIFREPNLFSKINDGNFIFKNDEKYLIIKYDNNKIIEYKKYKSNQLDIIYNELDLKDSIKWINCKYM